MLQSRGPSAFQNGVAHLMFVGVRPLMVSNLFGRQVLSLLLTCPGYRCDTQAQNYIPDGRPMAGHTFLSAQCVSHATTT